MNKVKRERIVLGLLGLVLVFAGWNLWSSLRPAGVVSTATGVEAAVAERSALDTDRFASVEIRSDWADAIAGEGGDRARDPFSYGAAPAATRRAAPAPPPTPPPTIRPGTPAAPPPPPPLPLRYVGFSRIGGAGADLRAVLMGDDNVPYPALPGDTLMGRYRIHEVTEQYVVVEDLQSGRRERLLASIQN